MWASAPTDCFCAALKKTGELALPRLLSCRFYIDIRTDLAFDLSVGILKGFDVFPDQYQDMAVHTAALIVRHKTDLVQHFLFYSNGHALYRHINTPIQIYCVFILFLSYVIIVHIDTLYIYNI